ncbi:MAG TPA: hypothetical protein VFB60_18175 [Ktedonobacteraceae bacterium]|nr:hypothetical protein [Ktedonobacteraceae bacterium]
MFINGQEIADLLREVANALPYIVEDKTNHLSHQSNSVNLSLRSLADVSSDPAYTSPERRILVALEYTSDWIKRKEHIASRPGLLKRRLFRQNGSLASRWTEEGAGGGLRPPPAPSSACERLRREQSERATTFEKPWYLAGKHAQRMRDIRSPWQALILLTG